MTLRSACLPQHPVFEHSQSVRDQVLHPYNTAVSSRDIGCFFPACTISGRPTPPVALRHTPSLGRFSSRWRRETFAVKLTCRKCNTNSRQARIAHQTPLFFSLCLHEEGVREQVLDFLHSITGCSETRLST